MGAYTTSLECAVPVPALQTNVEATLDDALDPHCASLMRRPLYLVVYGDADDTDVQAQLLAERYDMPCVSLDACLEEWRDSDREIALEALHPDLDAFLDSDRERGTTLSDLVSLLSDERLSQTTAETDIKVSIVSAILQETLDDERLRWGWVLNGFHCRVFAVEVRR